MKIFCGFLNGKIASETVTFNENIVTVSALKTSIHQKGEVYEFTVTFNSQTKEVVNISASIG